MQVTEFEIRDYIYNKGFLEPEYSNYSPYVEIIEKEFEICGKRIDLLGIDQLGNLFVIEIKKGIIDGNAYVQALSYMKSIMNYFDINDIERRAIYGILIGKEIDNRTKTCICGCEYMTYIEFDLGLSFDPRNYTPIEDYYKEYADNNKSLANIIRERLLENGEITDDNSQAGD